MRMGRKLRYEQAERHREQTKRLRKLHLKQQRRDQLKQDLREREELRRRQQEREEREKQQRFSVAARGDPCSIHHASQSLCSRAAGCKWYGRLNGGSGGCVTQGGPNDPNNRKTREKRAVKHSLPFGDPCSIHHASQSLCSRAAGCKWYGRLNGGSGGCVTQ